MCYVIDTDQDTGDPRIDKYFRRWAAEHCMIELNLVILLASAIFLERSDLLLGRSIPNPTLLLRFKEREVLNAIVSRWIMRHE